MKIKKLAIVLASSALVAASAVSFASVPSGQTKVYFNNDAGTSFTLKGGNANNFTIRAGAHASGSKGHLALTNGGPYTVISGTPGGPGAQYVCIFNMTNGAIQLQSVPGQTKQYNCEVQKEDKQDVKLHIKRS